MTWRDICRSEQCSGRWVALDNVRYDPSTSRPIEADVVDVDEDLGELCARMRASDQTSCAILFCEDEPEIRPLVKKQPPASRRAVHH
jgi:hypothetical protein